MMRDGFVIATKFDVRRSYSMIQVVLHFGAFLIWLFQVYRCSDVLLSRLFVLFAFSISILDKHIGTWFEAANAPFRAHFANIALSCQTYVLQRLFEIRNV